MSGFKRKDAPSGTISGVKKQKTSVTKRGKPWIAIEQTDSGGEDGFANFSDEEEEKMAAGGAATDEDLQAAKLNGHSKATNENAKPFKLENNTTSAEAHAKQRLLAKERKASKPNADAIQRSKRIWERLRRKSHVPADERKQLVAELFDIITSRVRDFVFKHDSVRVIQCALKYANQEQRRVIVEELKGDLRALSESRYGKFLVAKMVSSGDASVNGLVVEEFYGHVRRLINHPEASWIVDDIYRQIATAGQKTMMLREWYGAEFALFHRKASSSVARPKLEEVTETTTADLVKILEKNPEKRKPILQYLLQTINSLIQKKMTGFTMLHDAMLQYFLALNPGSDEHTELLEILKGDIDKETEGGGGDLFRNLAFTKSGSRLVCLALAYGSAKDRKMIVRTFKDTIETMAFDQHAKMVLVTAVDVVDDTKMSYKSILSELLGQHGITDETQRLDRLEAMIVNLNARLPILYPLAGMVKWLVSDAEKALLNDVHSIRTKTSKKEPDARRKELLSHISAPLLDFAAKRAENLVQSSFGCQFLTEVLLETEAEEKAAAKTAVAALAASDPTEEGHAAKNAAAGRMLKTLVLGGQFDSKTKKVELTEPRLGFADALYPVIKDRMVEWACSDSSFVVVGLLESEDVEEDVKVEVKAALKKGRKRIEGVAKGDGKEDRGNAGARILVGRDLRGWGWGL
ncbi:Pumilio y domain member 6 [Vermiconidia calcicola]|uniref:Pumilio y domain member 6 n=1 Tax=Vermiconidia calcicola TaxID=1690605 RepID=A0ACC3NZ14_9PEZI|nr:Pumilio y domain member 6 [Vermiconidia calcicola]